MRYYYSLLQELLTFWERVQVGSINEMADFGISRHDIG